MAVITWFSKPRLGSLSGKVERVTIIDRWFELVSLRWIILFFSHCGGEARIKYKIIK
ncbi:hypothetical protein HMPREF9374_3264 [Desmospora sp. 8437]|nr:hypothetical protein HMPREF9374_3264 [Desmospora sp. 8437]